VILRSLLVRLGWRPRNGSRESAKAALLRKVREDREAVEAGQAAEAERNRPPPTREELIERGILLELRPPMPFPAKLNLPPGGDDYWRAAGLMRGRDDVPFAMVQLLPDDVFWLNEAMFPQYEWAQVMIGDRLTEVQRMGNELCIKNPPRGAGPGCWLKLY